MELVSLMAVEELAQKGKVLTALAVSIIFAAVLQQLVGRVLLLLELFQMLLRLVTLRTLGLTMLD
jgi:hypothetical protein